MGCSHAIFRYKYNHSEQIGEIFISTLKKILDACYIATFSFVNLLINMLFH